jgi:hypothetical protein
MPEDRTVHLPFWSSSSIAGVREWVPFVLPSVNSFSWAPILLTHFDIPALCDVLYWWWYLWSQ